MAASGQYQPLAAFFISTHLEFIVDPTGPCSGIKRRHAWLVGRVALNHSEQWDYREWIGINMAE